MANTTPIPEVTHTIGGIDITWNLDAGQLTLAGVPVILIWPHTALAEIFQSMYRLAGERRFAYVLQAQGHQSIDEEWAVISSYDNFLEGIAALTALARPSGWGVIDVVEYAPEQHHAVVRWLNNWEGGFQRAKGLSWGCHYFAGKLAGYFSRHFGVDCWATQRTFVAEGADYDEFLIAPSSVDVVAELHNIEREEQERQMQLELLVEQRTHELQETVKQLEQARQELAQAIKIADQEREAAYEATRLKSHFLATMSHELRTPLNAIINFAHFLDDPDYGLLNDVQSSFQKRVVNNAEHLLNLINDILDLSKIESGYMALNIEPTNILSLLHPLEATTRALIGNKPVTVTLECDAAIPIINIDQQRISQVLLNLVSNAAKFTDEGSIKIEVKYLQTQIAISVHDSGIGISPEKLPLIFDEFRQVHDGYAREYQGTGLGLSISKRLVELHGGSLSVESTPGVGSSFTATLPISTSPIVRSDVINSAEEIYQHSSDGSIAIIDDNPDSQVILNHILEEAGFTTYSITDSRDALTVLHNNPPSVIILDIQMPHMNGWNILEQLQVEPNLAHIPVILCTITDIERIDIRVMPNVRGYIRKPIRSVELITVISQITGSSHNSILIVDDLPDAREIMRIPLERQGFQITEAENGEQALEKMREQPPSLVILDLMMPRMDGFAVLSEIEKDPNLIGIPVIVVTAQELRPEEYQWIEERTQQYLCKPVNPHDFLSVVRQSINPDQR